jgi:hypothetical protein
MTTGMPWWLKLILIFGLLDVNDSLSNAEEVN